MPYYLKEPAFNSFQMDGIFFSNEYAVCQYKIVSESPEQLNVAIDASTFLFADELPIERGSALIISTNRTARFVDFCHRAMNAPQILNGYPNADAISNLCKTLDKTIGGRAKQIVFYFVWHTEVRLMVSYPRSV